MPGQKYIGPSCSLLQGEGSSGSQSRSANARLCREVSCALHGHSCIRSSSGYIVRLRLTTGLLSCSLPHGGSVHGILPTVARTGRGGQSTTACISLAAECIDTCCPGDCTSWFFEGLFYSNYYYRRTEMKMRVLRALWLITGYLRFSYYL